MIICLNAVIPANMKLPCSFSKTTHCGKSAPTPYSPSSAGSCLLSRKTRRPGPRGPALLGSWGVFPQEKKKKSKDPPWLGNHPALLEIAAHTPSPLRHWSLGSLPRMGVPGAPERKRGCPRGERSSTHPAPDTSCRGERFFPSGLSPGFYPGISRSVATAHHYVTMTFPSAPPARGVSLVGDVKNTA